MMVRAPSKKKKITIEFNHYFTGEKTTYTLENPGEKLTRSHCPIDNTPLVLTEFNQIATLYCCNNCGNNYKDNSKKGLEKAKKKIYSESKKRIRAMRDERSKLTKIIRLIDKQS